MYRILITFNRSFAGGGAVATTTLVPFDTKGEADEVFDNIWTNPSYSVLKMY